VGVVFGRHILGALGIRRRHRWESEDDDV